MMTIFNSGQTDDGRRLIYNHGWKKWNGIEHMIFTGGTWIGNNSLMLRDINKNFTLIIMANKDNKVNDLELSAKILPLIGYPDPKMQPRL